MKSKILLLIIFLAPAMVARPATNDLTPLLQQGLFDEEANHDLPTAIADYQSLATQFDRDRQVAATAIYRLGECYRKLGETNEAVNEYERILKEFSEQKDLVTLSRQNLTGLGAGTSANHFQDRLEKIVGHAVTKQAIQPPAASPEAGGTSVEASRLAAELAGLEQLQNDPEKHAFATLALFPDDDLKAMLLHLAFLDKQTNDLADTNLVFPPDYVTSAITETGRIIRLQCPTNRADAVLLAQAQRQKQLEPVGQRVSFIIGTQQARLQALQMGAGLESSPPKAMDAAPSTDDETREIVRIQQLIQNSPDLINVPGDGNATPLTKAAYNGWLKVAGYLLDHGADVNAGHPPALTEAAQAGNRAMTELLLSRGADVNARGSSQPPLAIAAGKGFQAVVEVLLANKADVNAPDKNDLERTPLISATRNDHGKIVKMLLDAGANPNTKAQDGFTALLLAAQALDPEMTKTLLAGGADPNISDNDGRTPLLLAAAGGSAESVRELLAAKADPNAGDDGGRTPLFFAAASGSAECVTELLAAKADPNGGRIDAPLFGAIQKMDSASAELLLKAGANPNLLGNADGDGGTRNNQRQRWTPFYRAISTRQFPMVQLLLKYHADPNDEQVDQRPLIFNALADTNILETLLNAGAQVEARDTSGQIYYDKSPGWTPLIASVRNSAYSEQNFPVESIAILLRHGANPNVPDNSFGTPPLMWTSGWGFDRIPNPQVLAFLLDHQADPNQRNFAGETMLSGLKILLNKYPQDQAPAIHGLIDQLHQHGALDILPDWNHITVTRAAANFTRVFFARHTNDWNQFTLLELVAVECQFLSSSGRESGNNYGDASSFWHNQALPFADLSQIRIRRPEPGRTNATDQTYNLLADLDSGDCSKDPLLKWGDVVEIPEADHPINEAWQGFPLIDLTNLDKCLTRGVNIIVKGQTNKITLALQMNFQLGRLFPAANNPPYSSFVRADTQAIPRKVSFWLGPVLLQSKLVLASSDLAHIKVSRRDPATGQAESCIVDCSSLSQNQYSDSDLWLRDGDVIEVPEKP